MTGLTGSRQCAVIERCQKKIRDANLSLISTGRLYIRRRFERGVCMKNIKNFRTMNCLGCQCDGCYECQSANCDICYRAECANKNDEDMYYAAEDEKRCNFDQIN